ncbi:Vacuolar amino acid transporter 5 [Wickerhamomyces ciferrii]|uniref:Vacuolar amino acid transporter 5 n=1 Tax=Wickerhamomyces ciferrii (strain ATCC 14091 / BCRC 22168 / CBS 111 / JCM 3599 / NBRC 0793 / NRRL Y-1031 F-60-10) TaxID=1206466 RepID=K0KV62_WICCF|nr:Vacuolar amino acid transporter 5 [Wickerhamomyces ciferrii]CCH47131.1 Vacuolar amino acid transporter 5 [Wickerhamomyces ciferrii]
MGSKSTAQSAAINLLNTIIGAGMLAMPYAIRADGIILGILVIITSAITSSFGLYLQGQCSKYVKTGEASFFALAQLTYPQLSVVFDLAIAIKCFGVGISYLVVVGDLVPKIVQSLANEEFINQHLILTDRNFWITIIMIFIVVPLSFLKKLDSLKYASMIALSSVVYLVILVFVHFAKNDIVDKGPVRFIKPYNVSSIFASFPIFVFAYTCHQNMFSLVNELDDKSNKNINKVIGSAIGIAMTLYILVGVTGYLSFGDNVEPNVIVGYSHAISSTIGRIAIVILVMLSFPLQCHPARASINHILFYFKQVEKKVRTAASNASMRTNITNRTQGQNNTTATQSDESDQLIDYDYQDGLLEEGSHAAVSPLKGTRFIIITSIILILSYLIAISVTSLAHVLAFVGSTGSTSISFILPGIFGFKLIGSEYIDPETGTFEEIPRKTKIIKYLGCALSIWGLLVMVICLSATIFLGASH